MNREKYEKIKKLRKPCNMGDSFCIGYNAAIMEILGIIGHTTVIDKSNYPKPSNNYITDAYEPKKRKK